ncbi:hypothetical protein TWF217_001372 [Orbilia oligospora]|nr:hypothetical protein TWF217_001372 [Orbilia oligospora]
MTIGASQRRDRYRTRTNQLPTAVSDQRPDAVMHMPGPRVKLCLQSSSGKAQYRKWPVLRCIPYRATALYSRALHISVCSPKF